MPACHAGGRGFESRPDRLKPCKSMIYGAFAFSIILVIHSEIVQSL